VAAGKEGEPPVGLIDVDKSALIFNSKTKKWETGVEYRDMGDGTFDYVKNNAIKSYSKLSNIQYIYGKWHSGQPVTIADIMYATAFNMSGRTKTATTINTSIGLRRPSIQPFCPIL